MAFTTRYIDTSGIYGNESDVVTETAVSRDDTGTGYSGVFTAEIVSGIEIAFGVLGVVSNLKVIIVMGTDPAMLKTRTNMYITGQSVIDAIAALFQILISYFPYDGRYFLSLGDDLYCRLFLNRTFLWGSIGTSSYNMVAMTTERYLAVVHPIWHKLHVTRKVVIGSMAGAWLIGYGYQVPFKLLFTKVIGGRCLENQYPNQAFQKGFAIYTSFHNFLIPVTIAIATYGHMVCKLRTRVGSEDRSGQASGTSRARKNVIRTMLFVIGGYIACWTGLQLLFNLYQAGFNINRNSDYYRLARVLVVFNCTINPFIYMIQYKAYQRALRRLIRKVTRGRCGGVEDKGDPSASLSVTG